jgi:hypothetical protein
MHRLIIESPAHDSEFKYFTEDNKHTGTPTLYIEGPYLMAEGVNKNKRKYPIHELRNEVDRYLKEMVETKRAMGELNHPEHADVDLERACHIVTNLREEDNVFYGKSKILSTPMGLIAKSLINDGVKLGMSSRALGQLIEKEDYNEVKDLRLVAIDCVADPSFPKAFVNGILESAQYVLSTNNKYEPVYDKFVESLRSLPKREVDSYLKDQILKFITSF